MTPDAIEALVEAVTEALTSRPHGREYTLERLGRAGWHPVPGTLEGGPIKGLAKAMYSAAALSIAVNAAYRVVSPKGRVMAVYSSGDLVSVPLVIP